MISVSSLLPPFTVLSFVHLYDISSCLFLPPLVARLKAELFFVPFRSMSACFLEVSFPFVFSHPSSIPSSFFLPFSVPSSASPATSASTGIFPPLGCVLSGISHIHHVITVIFSALRHVVLSLLLFDSSEARICRREIHEEIIFGAFRKRSISSVLILLNDK